MMMSSERMMIASYRIQSLTEILQRMSSRGDDDELFRWLNTVSMSNANDVRDVLLAYIQLANNLFCDDGRRKGK
jgi:hypothetical protein